MPKRDSIKFSNGRLREIIAYHNLTTADLAKKIGMSEVGLQRRLRGEVAWKQTDIHRICVALDITSGEQIKDIFFTPLK